MAAASERAGQVADLCASYRLAAALLVDGADVVIGAVAQVRKRTVLRPGPRDSGGIRSTGS